MNETPCDGMSAGILRPADAAASASLPGSSSRRWLRLLPWALVAAILLAQGLYVRAFYGAALATPDDNGYWAQGSLIATTGRTWFRAESDVQYIGMHWLLNGDGRYVSRYPPGLAVLVAAVCRLFGYEASVLINPVLASLALLGLYLLGRRMVGRWWALVPCALLAATPTFNQHALWCFAHMAVTALLVWGILLLRVWADSGRGWFALLGGLTLGCIPTIRYPEAVFALGAAVYLLWDAAKSPAVRRHVALAILGAAVPVFALLVRNQMLFGSFLETGYALTGEQTGFGWSYFRSHAIPEFRAILGEGAGPVFLLGLMGMLAMLGSPSQRRNGSLFLLLVGPLTLVYMAYYWGGVGRAGGAMGGGGAGGGHALRFFLPTFPWYALAGVWMMAEGLRGRAAPLRFAAGIVLVLVYAAWGIAAPISEFARLGRTKAVLADVTRQLKRTVPSGAVLLGTRDVFDHLDFVRRWRLADLSVIRGQRLGMRGPGMASQDTAAGRPSPMQAAKRSVLADRYGDMAPGERVMALARELTTWAGTNKVYFVGAAEELERLEGVFRAEDFRILARVAVRPASALEGGDVSPDVPGGPSSDGLPAPDAVVPPDGAPSRPGDAPGSGGWRDAGPYGGRPDRIGARAGRGDMGGRTGRFGGGGPGGFGRLLDAKEIVIAEWNGHLATPRPQRRSPPDAQGRGDRLI